MVIHEQEKSRAAECHSSDNDERIDDRCNKPKVFFENSRATDEIMLISFHSKSSPRSRLSRMNLLKPVRRENAEVAALASRCAFCYGSISAYGNGSQGVCSHLPASHALARARFSAQQQNAFKASLQAFGFYGKAAAAMRGAGCAVLWRYGAGCLRQAVFTALLRCFRAAAFICSRQAQSINGSAVWWRPKFTADGITVYGMFWQRALCAALPQRLRPFFLQAVSRTKADGGTAAMARKSLQSLRMTVDWTSGGKMEPCFINCHI
ncbi:hypothetical protein NPIL_635131 [Nephila pilipes]|uniref:Uncharacterized protein n=1 Tax=Nephila pilipes TaxID=299642 RepID=A0A8X6R2R3_NEPPI|nr:hypothetical protein NPIL_635131 [Nephila pilipes]